jgi:hypothetical protein
MKVEESIQDYRRGREYSLPNRLTEQRFRQLSEIQGQSRIQREPMGACGASQALDSAANHQSKEVSLLFRAVN